MVVSEAPGSPRYAWHCNYCISEHRSKSSRLSAITKQCSGKRPTAIVADLHSPRGVASVASLWAYCFRNVGWTISISPGPTSVVQRCQLLEQFINQRTGAT
jgi:hypothetical protein